MVHVISHDEMYFYAENTGLDRLSTQFRTVYRDGDASESHHMYREDWVIFVLCRSGQRSVSQDKSPVFPNGQTESDLATEVASGNAINSRHLSVIGLIRLAWA